MLVNQQDQSLLEQVGVESPESLLTSAAYMVREAAAAVYLPTSALSQGEQQALSEIGALGADWSESEQQQAVQQGLAQIATSYARLLASSLNGAAVAKKLGVSASRVRQMSLEGKLYNLEHNGKRYYPQWQFHQDQLAPGLDRILPHIPLGVHPLGIQAFFTQINPDLHSDQIDAALSPLDWLFSGHNPQAVTELASWL